MIGGRHVTDFIPFKTRENILVTKREDFGTKISLWNWERSLHFVENRKQKRKEGSKCGQLGLGFSISLSRHENENFLPKCCEVGLGPWLPGKIPKLSNISRLKIWGPILYDLKIRKRIPFTRLRIFKVSFWQMGPGIWISWVLRKLVNFTRKNWKKTNKGRAICEKLWNLVAHPGGRGLLK